MAGDWQVIRGRGGGGGKGGGGGSRAPVEDPNTLRSKATARVVDLISEGEIVGLVDGAKSIFFDDTALQNDDDTFNFTNVAWAERKGLPDQDYIPGFPNVQAEVVVGTEVTIANGPVVRTLSDANATSARVTIRIPALTFQDMTTGDIRGTSVQIKVEVRSFGGIYATVVNDTITGKTTSPYERAYRFELPAGGAPWDIRVTRITADSGQANLNNKTFWSSYTSIIDNKLIYPNSALIGVAVDSQTFGGRVPSRSYDVKGRIIQVPSNYDPETREYTGIWDGTFKEEWTDNPAWVLYDLIINNRYGLGRFVAAAQIDKWALYEIAQYCDGLVSDGFDGEEPRFTFNYVINTRQEAYTVITTLASAFRGMAFWASGAITAVQDAPRDAGKLVTPANVIGGTFDYSGSGLRARHTVAKVTWNDPADAYRPAIEVVEDIAGIDRYGLRPTDVLAFGCTSRGQAARLGRWILDSEASETELVTYRASWDHANVHPGEIIRVADPSYAGVRFGGRVASYVVDTAGDAHLTLDDEIELSGAEDYVVTVTLPDGTLEERGVVNTGTTDTLQLASPFSAAPDANAIWVLSATNVEPRPFRVIAMRETDKHIFEITALFHDETKYARIEDGLTLETPSFTALPSGPIGPALTPITTREYLYRVGPSIKAAVTVSWTLSADPRVQFYQVQKLPPGENWQDAGETGDTSIDVLDVDAGVWGFRVRALDGVGRPSPWLTLESVLILGLNAKPENVENFNITVLDAVATLTWSPVTDLDLAHYVIKFSTETTGANWGNSFLLLGSITNTSVQVPAANGTYLIKAVDLLGNESDVEALAISTSVGINSLNAVELTQQDPVFPGQKTNAVVLNSRLRLSSVDTLSDWVSLAAVRSLAYGVNGVSGSGVYDFDEIIDLGEVFTSRLTGTIKVQGVNLANVMATWLPLSAVQRLSGADPGTWNVELQVRTANDDPLGTDATWSAWQPFTVGDYTARAFEFRLLMFSYDQSVTPLVEQLRVQIDMPDRVAGDRNIVCPDAGLRVDFDPPFRAIPALGIDGDSLQSGDRWERSVDAEGFNIQFYDNNDDPVERSFDWIAKGYGRRQTA